MMSIRLRPAIILAPFLSVAISLLLGGLIILALGKDPILAYTAMFRGALGDIFGGRVRFGETVLKMTPLLLIGLGVGFAMHCRVWNIGADGQLYIGALASTLLALESQSLTGWIVIPSTMIAAFLGGAAYAAVAAFFKARYEVDEIITTFLMNFVAFYFVSYLCRGPLRDPEGWLPYSRMIGENAMLPILLPGTRINIGILVALVLAAAVHVIIRHTSWGYELQAVGANSRAARFAGIPVERNVLLALAVSGGMAGLAGMNEVQGNVHRLQDTLSPAYGFTGLVVAIMGRRHPGGILLTALLFAVLRVGGDAMQEAARISNSIVELIQGVIVLVAIGTEVLVQGILQRVLVRRSEGR